MSDRLRLEAALSEHAGERVAIESQRALSGGCINDAFHTIASGKSYFIKANRPSFFKAFSAEAEALRELGATNTVRVPEVIALIEGESQAYLVLEYIETRPSRTGDWKSFGEQLAKLHQMQQPYFGWSRDNFIGTTDQPNPKSESWIDFFREHRLERQIRLCRAKGYTVPFADRLLDRLPQYFDSYMPTPSLLHGDLWSGNAGFDQKGDPFIYDPASYYGDRETDLAFTEFFGGFPTDFYEQYDEVFPLDSGYAQRKTLYNLYHCLNHLKLFGASYGTQAEQMIHQLLSSE